MGRLANKKTQIWLSVAVLLSGLSLFINNLNATDLPDELLRWLGALFLMVGMTALRAISEYNITKGGR